VLQNSKGSKMEGCKRRKVLKARMGVPAHPPAINPSTHLSTCAKWRMHTHLPKHQLNPTTEPTLESLLPHPPMKQLKLPTCSTRSK